MARSSWLMWWGLAACVSGEVEAKPETSSDVEVAETTARVVESPILPVPPDPVVVGDYRSVRGQVVDKWGMPVEGATVTAQVGRLDWTTSSDAEGRFVFAAIADRGLQFTAETDDGVATRWVQRPGPIVGLALVLEPAATVVVRSAFSELDQVVVRHATSQAAWDDDDGHGVAHRVALPSDEVALASLRARYGPYVAPYRALEQDILARGGVGQAFRVRAHIAHDLVVPIADGFDLVCGRVRLEPGEVFEVVCGKRGRMRVTGRVVDLRGEPLVAARVAFSDGQNERVERSGRDGRFEVRAVLDGASECTVETTIDWESYTWWPTTRRALSCRPGAWVDLGDMVLVNREELAEAGSNLPIDFWYRTSVRQDDGSRIHRCGEHWNYISDRPPYVCLRCGKVATSNVWAGIDEARLAALMGFPEGTRVVRFAGRLLDELGVEDVLAWRLLEPGASLVLEVRDTDGLLRTTEVEPEWLFSL